MRHNLYRQLCFLGDFTSKLPAAAAANSSRGVRLRHPVTGRGACLLRNVMPRPRQEASWSVIWKPLIVGVLTVAGVAAAGGYYWQWRRPVRELWLPGTVETQEVR